jgi:hypothetical protein
MRRLTSFREWFEFIASVASIVGFFVSLYVLLEVRQIRKQFLLRLRISDLLEALRKQAAEMSSRLNDFEESQHEIEVILAQCESTLQNFLPKLSGVEKRPTKRLVKLLRSYHRSSWRGKKHELDRDEAWRVYTDLQGVIESIGHLQEDIRSGR